VESLGNATKMASFQGVGRNPHVDYRFADQDLDCKRLNMVEMLRFAPEAEA
jgi:hypothetical protein